MPPWSRVRHRIERELAREQEQLGVARALIEEATRDTVLWLQADPSAVEREHVLAIQAGLADLNRIVERGMERRREVRDAWEWSEGVTELQARLHQARELHGSIVGKGLARLPDHLPKELPGRKPKPKPPEPVRPVYTGFKSFTLEPKPTQVPPDFPPYYPNELEPRTAVIRSEAATKFPHQTQILDLCRYFISKMHKHICKAVQARKMKAHDALSDSGMERLIHSWLVYNCDRDDERFRLMQEIRKCEEWRKLEKAILKIADAANVHNGTVAGANQAESSGVKNSDKTTQSVGSKTADRRGMVDAFISEVLATTGEKIRRKDIWFAAGYEGATEFERFQRNDPRSTQSAATNFNRVFDMTPADFVRLLETRKASKVRAI